MQQRPELTYIVQAPHNETLKDRLTVAIRHGSGVRKLFKITFRPKSADFYIAFPYLQVPSFRCGVQTGQTGETIYDTSAAQESVSESTVAVKLSFHESGVVHFKAQDNAPRGGTKLASLNSLPLMHLSGNHVFTVEADGLSNFDEATESEKTRRDFVIVDVPHDVARVKITGFAGFTPASVAGKYTGNTVAGEARGDEEPIALPPSVAVRFVRPHLSRPLYLGLYVAGGASLQQAPVPTPSILALAGFTPNKIGTADFLFLHANDPTVGQ